MYVFVREPFETSYLYVILTRFLFIYLILYLFRLAPLHLNFKTTVFERERSQLVVKETDSNGGRSSVLIGCRFSVVLTDSLMLCRDWSV